MLYCTKYLKRRSQSKWVINLVKMLHPTSILNSTVNQREVKCIKTLVICCRDRRVAVYILQYFQFQYSNSPTLDQFICSLHTKLRGSVAHNSLRSLPSYKYRGILQWMFAFHMTWETQHHMCTLIQALNLYKCIPGH